MRKLATISKSACPPWQPDTRSRQTGANDLPTSSAHASYTTPRDTNRQFKVQLVLKAPVLKDRIGQQGIIRLNFLTGGFLFRKGQAHFYLSSVSNGHGPAIVQSPELPFSALMPPTTGSRPTATVAPSEPNG